MAAPQSPKDARGEGFKADAAKIAAVAKLYEGTAPPIQGKRNGTGSS